MSLTIGITGLGYVGLPLALRFAESGAFVLGFDIDAEKVRLLNAGESYIRHIEAARIASANAAGRFASTTDFARIAECDAVLICVPTPLTRNREPDLSFVLGTARLLGPHLKKGTLVCLESTTYPGTTDESLRETLEETSGLRAGVDFHLAYSPEREDPGNPASNVAHIPKVVGGLTPACREKALAVYGIAIEKLVPVSSCRAAEATKLMENIFRSVNIALVNELKVVYEAMGIDIWEVIGSAKTKPFGYMPFYPGPGLGGHCIPIDPFYLTWKAREYGKHTRFIELAGEINTAMPDYVVAKVMETLNGDGKAVKGARILLLGLAYRANVDDDRESPSYILIERLEALGAVVSYNDPYVPEIRPSREHAALAGRRSVPISNDFDLILLVTAHDAYRTFDFSTITVPVVDSRGCVDPTTCRVVRSQDVRENFPEGRPDRRSTEGHRWSQTGKGRFLPCRDDHRGQPPDRSHPYPPSMKILVAGAGSIGLRHARVLREAGHDVAIQTARPEAREALRRDGWRVFDAVADFAGCRHAIVATRTSLHPATAIPLLEAGMDLLVEKPLAVDGREGARLANEARRLGRKVWCGLNLRFCRSLNLFRRERERVGRLHAAQVECRSYLPDWRPGSDFRTSYSASSAEGGVLRDLVHEIDYAGWILGWPQRVFARFDFGGRLGIAAEEAASLDAVLAEGTSVQIGLDYLTRVPMRRMRLFGSEGVLSWDGITHEVAFAGPGGLRENWEDRETKDENLLCQDLAFLEGTDDRLVSAEEALRGLAVCDAARRSAASGHDEPVILP